MRGYHSGKTIDSELKEMLSDIDFLYQKGLYNQCEKLHRKAEALAVRSDKKARLMEILEWKARLQSRNSEQTKDDFHKKIFLNEKRLLTGMERSLEIKAEVLDVFSLIRKKGFARSDEDLLQIREILRKFRSYKYPQLSFNDKYYLNYLNSVYYSSSGAHARSLIYSKRNIELLMAIPEKLRKEEFEKHIVSLNNLVVNLIHLNKHDETSSYIEEIRSLATHNIRENILLWLSSYKLVLGISISSAEFEKALRISNEMSRGMVLYSEKIPPAERLLLRFNRAVICFYNKRYSEAIYELNAIINEHEMDVRSDIQSFARIIRLIVLWEKGEQEMLPYAAVSAYRFLVRRKRLYQAEHLILRFIREELPLINTAGKQKLAFMNLKEKLEVIVKDPFERKVLEYFDFITWIESKLEKKDYGVKAREKLGKSIDA
jgi:hypothetical protein